MDQVISNELLNLINLDGINDTTERIKINRLCNDFIMNGGLLESIDLCLSNTIKKDNFNFLLSLVLICKKILVCIQSVEYYKNVSVRSGRIKYLLYAVMINFFYEKYPLILEKYEIKEIRELYVNIYDIIVMEPSDIISKSCVKNIFSIIKKLF